jgi:predicted DNA-binding transcriptional regulator AlpA
MNTSHQTSAAQEPSPPAVDVLLSAKSCAAALEIAESTWWAWVSDPSFPVRPVRYGERFTRFRSSELSAWISSLASGAAKPNSMRRSEIAASEETRKPGSVAAAATRRALR